MTEAEILNLYLLLRQKDVKTDLIANGVSFGDVIEGRNTARGKFMLTSSTVSKINDIVKSNPHLQEAVKQIDEAYNKLHKHLAEAYKTDTGFDLEKIDNYFPTRLGLTVESQRRIMKNIDYLTASYARMGNDKSPFRITDAYSTVNASIENAAHYVGYNRSINNGRKLLKRIKKQYDQDKSRKDYDLIMGQINALEGNMNRLEDSSELYSAEGDKKLSKFFHKTLNNISVAVLGLNVPTMMKQPISYLIAKEVIDSKYLEQAGWGAGGIAGIGFNDIIKQLKKSPSSTGQTILPIEWRQDKNNPVYKLIEEFSPILVERFKGSIDRELGEQMMDSRINNDTVEIPLTGWAKKMFGRGEGNLKFSKNRVMEGIKAFDTATVMAIWKAAELEAQEKYGLSKKNKKAFYEHVARRTEEIVNKTQPTFDQNNRSSLASNRDVFSRLLTMFSSARSKMGMLIMEGAVDVMNNPTKENKIMFAKRMINITVLASAAATMVDLLRSFAFDDEETEDILATSGWKMWSANVGNFFGINLLSDYATSRLDDQPWRREIQDPVSQLAGNVMDVFVHSFKGDFDKAFQKSITSTFKATGAPLFPYIATKKSYEKYIKQ